MTKDELAVEFMKGLLANPTQIGKYDFQTKETVHRRYLCGIALDFAQNFLDEKASRAKKAEQAAKENADDKR